MAAPFVTIFVTNTLSSYPAAFIRTFIKAPITALRAQSAPTPASDTELGLPVSAIAFIICKLPCAACITLNGISMAYLVASCMVAVRKIFSSSVAFGNAKAVMIWLNALVSASTSFSNSFLHCSPFSAQLLNSSQRSSHPFLCADKLATIVANDTPSAPT